MGSPQFTQEEMLAIKHMMEQLAHYCREDIMGAILYTGAFHYLPEPDAAVVRLANKLEFQEGEKKFK